MNAVSRHVAFDVLRYCSTFGPEENSERKELICYSVLPSKFLCSDFEPLRDVGCVIF